MRCVGGRSSRMSYLKVVSGLQHKKKKKRDVQSHPRIIRPPLPFIIIPLRLC